MPLRAIVSSQPSNGTVTSHAVVVPDHALGQDLQSHHALEPCILGFVYYAHPALAELLKNTVVSDHA